MPIETRLDPLRSHIDRLPRFPLAQLPTPLEPLPRFSKVLGGPQIFIKRDDCTGLALGGNKTRHNEFLIADALEQGADMFVWGAGVQSNNCRQTAAACAKAGLDCQLVLSRCHQSAQGTAIQGNLLLDHLLGASVRFVDDPIGAPLDRRIAEVAAEFREQGRNVYMWKSDRVKPLAAVSYTLCMHEIAEQTLRQEISLDAVYVSSAGSTGAGLALGAAILDLPYPVRSICPLQWEWDTRADMAQIANEAAEFIGLETRLQPDDLDITFDYIGPGYAQPSVGGLEAIALLARTEGILLDPVYSGKAMAGLIDHIRRGILTPEHKVLFVHTGGTPALFAYNQELAEGIAPRVLPSQVAD